MATTGEIIDALNCKIDLEPGHLVVGAVVVAKVLDSTGEVHLATAWSDGLDWLQRVGPLRVAEQLDLPTDAARESD